MGVYTSRFSLELGHGTGVRTGETEPKQRAPLPGLARRASPLRSVHVLLPTLLESAHGQSFRQPEFLPSCSPAQAWHVGKNETNVALAPSHVFVRAVALDV